MGAGILSMSAVTQTKKVLAEDVSSTTIVNADTPSYFGVKQYTGDVENTASLIDSNIFMFSAGESLKLSLKTNTEVTEGMADIYEYVYYPNPADISTFYFYQVNTFGLSVNGVSQTLPANSYEIVTEYMFTRQLSSINLESFEINFGATENETTGSTSNNAYKITNNEGNVVEGVYTLTLNLTLFTCTDGKTDASEEQFTSRDVTINYSFYVVDARNYLVNAMPTTTFSNFDSQVNTATSVLYNNYLYSNFSAEENENAIPFLTYDYERYELSITKEQANVSYSEQLVYDVENSTVVASGDDIVHIDTDETTHTNKVYFYNLGNYVVSYNEILLVDMQGEILSTREKHDLQGITNKTKKELIYVYGYQANYTNMDGTVDSNNMRPVAELKTLDFDNGVAKDSADITSSFLKSNDNYSQENANTTFLIANIADYITTSGVSPVKTDQTPIKFTQNATLSTTLNSYIYTTQQLSSNYQQVSGATLNGETLYRTKFNGQAEGARGTYIYLIAYTFANYYTAASTLSATTNFYQVFYFEINKDIPSVEVKTESGKEVYDFVNENIVVKDTTKTSPYNKEVDIRIYAQSFNGNLLSEFGGNTGISYNSLLAEGADSVTLETSAHYTIRLFYKNEETSSNILFTSTTGSFREQFFTIDKQPISNITGVNVDEIINSTNYRVINAMDETFTNQNIVVSWDNKVSGADTYAYYRYFPIESIQFYNSDPNYKETIISKMLTLYTNDSFLPINFSLNMDTTNNGWNHYKGNALEEVESGTVSAEYVFSDGGLYLVDVYDTAGNHAIKVFVIDYTAPIFAIYDNVEDTFSLLSGTTYISNSSELYWAKNKAIYVENLSPNYFTSYTLDDGAHPITQEVLETSDIFKDYTNSFTVAKDIYTALYTSLINSSYMRKLTLDSTIQTGDASINDYTSLYITVPLSSTYYFLNGNSYVQKSGSYSETIDVSDETTYQVLVRDNSNTKYDLNYAKTAQIQYTQYYSAYQKLIVSYDDSEFEINYTVTNGSTQTTEILSMGSVVIDTVTVDGEEHLTKTTYLNPTKMSKAFYLSFVPTKEIDANKKIQVDSVTIQYYPYTATSTTINGVKYYYYTLSDSYTQTPVYEYDGISDITEHNEPIRLNIDNITAPGKYIITRTYKVDDAANLDYNRGKDYYSRTFVLLVDRNNVITNPELVGSGDHLESLVGGDIFVSMYDNGETADLVVSFPNSYEGNTEGSSLYNTTTEKEIPRTVLTTNMFPVKVYVPRYKYTESVVLNADTDSYHFTVTNSEKLNQHYASEIISEYALYAEIYKDSLTNLYAKTTMSNSPSIENVTFDENGFLTFYRGSNKLLYLSEKGSYYVRIYQGRFGTEIGVNSFVQSLTFAFEIQNADPDFTIKTTSGATINSKARSGSTPETYYTNQSNVTLIWNKGSEYIADIDPDNITFKIGSTTLDASDAWMTSAPIESNNTYLWQISLSKLGVYSNGSFVDITMQYKNHDARFYNTVTKRIVVDLSAPHGTIDDLVNKTLSGGYISGLTEKSLRVHYTASMEETSSNSNTSYNTSNGNNTGNFAYYSYMVSSNFLSTLRTNKDYTTYARKLVDSNGKNTKYSIDYSQETTPADFLTSNFTEVSNQRLALESGFYYEIVETDMAGNLTIYTVYVVSYEPTDDETNNLISYLDGNGEEQAYTIDNYVETKAYSGATHNIYSRTGLQIDSLNYFGDAWAQFKLVTTNAIHSTTTSYFMLTPWDTSRAYAFVNGGVQTVSLSSLINGSLNTQYKHSITFYNRQSGNYETFYINTRNTDLHATLTDSQSREYIMFNQPSDAAINSTTTATTFLTKLKITANGTELFNKTNRLGFANLWAPSGDNVIVSNNTSTGTITFEINPNLGFASNTKILYEYVNNYGQTYTEIHFYKETIISQPISSENDLYAYYTTDGKLFYVTEDGFQYTYNPAKYSLRVYDYANGTKSENETSRATTETVTNTNGTRTMTISSLAVTDPYTTPYEENYVLDIFNDDALVKSIYLTLYKGLPRANFTDNTNLAGEFKFLDASRNNITEEITSVSTGDEIGYFSEVTLMYALEDSLLPIKYSISTDKVNWTEVSSGSVFKNESETSATYYLKVWYDEDYLTNEFGAAKYVYQYVPASQIYEFNLSSLTSTFWVEKTVDGVTTIVERSNTIFKTASGAQYSNHYIVNLNYADKDAIQIKTNKEQDIVAEKKAVYDSNGAVVGSVSSGVASELWLIHNDATPAFSTYIVITYIPTSEDFVKKFYMSNSNGIIETSTNLISATSKSFVVSQDDTSITEIELQWSKYYGIVQNEINISLVKDGITLKPTVYTREVNGESFNYCRLTYSGKYRISLYDNAGNVQKFNYRNAGQSDKFTLIFLKDVPFTVTYTNPETKLNETSLPIKQAIYNDHVTLNIDKASRSDFYTTGGYPTLTIYRNGVQLSSNAYTTTDANGKISYTFNQTGFYEYFFSATSNLSGVGKIREEKYYSFTIINANEYRYSYIFNQYSTYYVQKVTKDGNDVTAKLTKLLDVNKITANRTQYMIELPLSYLDEKTGAGTYMITVNSNDKEIKNSSIPTTFTYQVVIRVGTAPIKVSVPEGKGTTSAVTMTFNKTNIYEEMGECKIRILQYGTTGSYIGEVYAMDINSTTTGTTTLSIDRDKFGTFFLQVVAPSGNLLYSYKIDKKEPMNIASIIIIVAAVVLALAVIIIVIRLRKRIAVK